MYVVGRHRKQADGGLMAITRHPDTLPMHRVKNVFFVGIGGVGMSGIAEVMLNLGFSIYGTDQSSNVATQHLQALGASIYSSHAASNIQGMDVVIVSSAVDENNVELKAASEKRIPIVRRAEMLAELMRFKQGIAVAGTHGKTTTTSLVAAVMAQGDLDPTFIVGGRVNSVGSNSQLGSGDYLIAEADESDASFLHLQPIVAVITNIDADHLIAYENNFDKLRAAFIEFLHNIPFYGLAVLCIDDEVVRQIIPEVSRPYVTYGLSEDADVRAINIAHRQGSTDFEVRIKNDDAIYKYPLSLPGEHNILNALASIAVGCEFKVSHTDMALALGQFAGIGRRMQNLGQLNSGTLAIDFIEDYAHHPREIAASIEAVRQGWPERRLIVVFQPHRYTRTRDLFDDFVTVLADVDVLLLMSVYSAGEQHINHADSRAVAQALRLRGKLDTIVIDDDVALANSLSAVIMSGDIILTLGAGTIGRMAEQAFTQLSSEVIG